MPKLTADAYVAISRVLIPRLLGRIIVEHVKDQHLLPKPPRGMLEFDPAKGGSGVVDADAIDVLNDTVRCFGGMMQESEIEALASKLLEIVSTTGVIGADARANAAGTGAARKKAVAGMAQIATFFSDQLLEDLVKGTVYHLKAASDAPIKRRVLIAVIGAVSRAIPTRVGKWLQLLVPQVFAALSEEELNQVLEQLAEEGAVDSAFVEVKEAALVSLDDLLSCCVTEMEKYTDAAIDACVRHLSFDLGMIGDEMDEEEDEDEEDAGEDEDFEEEAQESDDDDSSWKVRRCAAKALHSLIETRSSDLIESGTLFKKIAPALIRRFSEREENVRLEVLATLTLLVKKVHDISPIEVMENGVDHPTEAVKSRKRRRGSSDADMYDHRDELPAKTVASARQELSVHSEAIVSGLIKLLADKSIATKQAATAVLREYVQYKHDGLDKSMDKAIPFVIETVRGKSLMAGSSNLTAGTSAFASVNSLRIETLDLLRAIHETHAPKITTPFLPTIADALVVSIGDPYFKVSCHAIRAAESVLESIDAPATPQQEAATNAALERLLDELIQRARSTKSELEVRQDAIHALAVCLAGSGTAALLTAPARRQDGLAILAERLRNETTRLAALAAVKRVVSSMTDPTPGSPEANWLQATATEIAQQLRKADPKVRASSLSALRAIVARASVASVLGVDTLRDMQTNLLPLLGSGPTPSDAPPTGAASTSSPAPALAIIERLHAAQSKALSSAELDAALCNLLLTPQGASALDALTALLETVGAAGTGAALMQRLLKHVGVGGDPQAVGPAIGTLLVAGGARVGVRVADFVAELENAQDDARRGLALAVLGEIALRMGPAARPALTPQTFLAFFDSAAETVPRVAAAALGRAAAGDVAGYAPHILPLLKRKGEGQRLGLLAVKELLMHPEKVRKPIEKFSDEMWTGLVGFAEAEDARVVSAECVGRLAALEPGKYLPLLQVSNHPRALTLHPSPSSGVVSANPAS